MPAALKLFRQMLASLLMLALVSSAALADPVSPFTRKLLDSAYAQIGVTVRYDPSYEKISYPGGDVALDHGVCTDVVIRAYRGLGVDLQKLVHEDIAGHFTLYPKSWGLKRPDTNIDHRRVGNLGVFFGRFGKVLPVSSDAKDYQPGDLVTWMVLGNLPHIGIVSDKYENGEPLIIHNIGQGARLEPILFAYPRTGHYRYEPAGAGQ